MSKPNRKIELGLATRAELVRTARRLFANGYDSVGTPAIAKAANVTRGALYHHFADKRALLAAVVEQIAEELVDRVEAASFAHKDDPVSAVIAGSIAFVSAYQDAETRQILLVDAPAILGWQAWREIDAKHGLGSLKEGLEACSAAGFLAKEDIEITAFLISGALNEAAFALAHASGVAASDQRFERCIKRMIQGLLSEDRRS